MVECNIFLELTHLGSTGFVNSSGFTGRCECIYEIAAVDRSF